MEAFSIMNRNSQYKGEIDVSPRKVRVNSMQAFEGKSFSL